MTVLTRNQAKTLIEMTQQNGGCTIWFDNSVKEVGYSVGNGAAGSKYSVNSLPNLQWDLMGLAERFNQLGAEGIGTWIDNGVVYVDPIFHIHIPAYAMMTAAAWGELAIYRLSDGTVINTTTEQ